MIDYMYGKTGILIQWGINDLVLTIITSLSYVSLPVVWLWLMSPFTCKGVEGVKLLFAIALDGAHKSLELCVAADIKLRPRLTMFAAFSVSLCQAVGQSAADLVVTVTTAEGETTNMTTKSPIEFVRTKGSLVTGLYREKFERIQEVVFDLQLAIIGFQAQALNLE